MSFLRVIRYQNLLMIAFMQLVFRFGFLKLRDVDPALADWQYILLVLSTVCIAAGGYLINNIFDQETDLVNKPGNVVIGREISESSAYNYYAILNIIGVAIGFYLSNVIGKPGFAAIFIVIAATLYVYATSLKQSLLIGNIIVALLLAMSVIITGIFDLFPLLNDTNRDALGIVFSVLLDYAIFAFIINFIREIVKDLEDVNGDYNQGMTTLPIVLGIARTSKVVFWLNLIPIGLVLFYCNKYFIANDLLIATAYTLLFIVGLLIYFSINMWSAKSQKQFHHLSNVLKLVLLFGIVSVVVISLNIKHHA